MRQVGKKTKHKGIESYSDGSYRIVAKVTDPRTGKPKFIDRLTREVNPQMSLNDAVALRAKLINEVKAGSANGNVPHELPRLVELCSSSWITFLANGVSRKRSAIELGREVEKHLVPRWGDHFVDRIEIAEIDAWVRVIERDNAPKTVRARVSILRRILAKARGQYKLPPLDWSLVTLPKVTDDHAKANRLPVDDIVKALLIIKSEHTWYAPLVFAMYSTGLRYCHAAALRWAKLAANGVVAIEDSYDYKTKEFNPVVARKNAPPEIKLEPFTLDLVRDHRKRLMRENHPGLQSGLLFPSVTGTLPVGNDQANDVWREAQLKAGIVRPISIHGIRHSMHDIARKRGIDSATVKAMAGHSTDARHFLYSQGVDLEETNEASCKIMDAFHERMDGKGPTVGVETQNAMAAFAERAEGRDPGRNGSVGTGDVAAEGRAPTQR